MHLKRAFSTGRWPRWLAGSLGVLFFLGVVASVTAEPPERLRKDRAERSLVGADHLQRAMTMDRNRVIMVLTQEGEVGSAGSSVGGGGFWISEANQYIFSSGPNLGALIPNGDGDGNAVDTAMFIGGPFSQVTFGSLEFAKLPNSIGLGTGAAASAGVFWDSTFEPDAENFPDPCTVDAFRINLFPSLQPFEGQPFPGFADQTVCWATNDITQGVCADCGGKRLGAESVQTAFAFGVPAVQDFVFVAFRMFNRSSFINASNSPSNPAGPYDFEETILSIAIDPDVGDATDDQITFFPDIGTMVYWDANFAETGFIGTPGFGAVSVFPVPDPQTGESFSLENFTVFTRDAGRDDPRSPQEWYRVISGDPNEVIFEVDPTDIRGQTSTNRFSIAPGEFVEIYAAFFFAPVAGSPPSLLIAESPFQQDNVTPRPGANPSPAFANIIRVQQTAQATFDAGFVVPTAPPKPAFNLIPGDHQVTVTWDASPVESVNPFAKVAHDPFARLSTGDPDPDAPGQGFVLEAGTIVFIPELDQGGTTGFVTAEEAGLTGVEVTNPAFNADFVVQDFQGFRVYRSLTGLAEDAELIFQADLADAITGGVFCVAAIPVFGDDGEFVENVCTEQAELPIGEDTGLSFSVIDRGGSFPTPSQGIGLINGIPVSYTVTSFSVNEGQSPVDIPPGTEVVPGAAPLVLEAGLQPFESATPRSNSSALTQGSSSFVTLATSGDVCDPGEPTAEVDPNTGEYIDFRDCTNGILAQVTEVRGTNIPSGDFFFVIDSLTVAPGFYDDTYFIATGGSRVWFHWETAGGSLATDITPTVGFFDQGFEFAHTEPVPVSFSLDTNPNDVGGDAAITLTTMGDYSAIEDLEVNGESIHKEELGGEHVGEARPHRVDNSSLADAVVIGNARDGGGGSSREYSQPGPYATGGTSYELTWSVEGGTYSGTVVRLVDGEPIPEGGQPKGPDNPHTPDDFVAGYNWGFIGPDDPAAVAARIMPASPLTNEMQLNLGDSFAIFVPGQSVTIQGIRDLPEDGETWTFLIDSGYQRGFFGREDPDPAGDNLWHYNDFNIAAALGEAFPIQAGVTNLHPGARFRLSLEGATNELANADLSQITVVPNPFIAADELQRGRGLQRILFTNLPPQATVRIYTISGNLVRVLEHTDGDGTMEWDVRTRFDLLAASGNYYYHVTTPDGRTHLGRFAVVN